MTTPQTTTAATTNVSSSAGEDSEQAINTPLPTSRAPARPDHPSGQELLDAQYKHAAGIQPPPLADSLLSLAADVLDDLEKVRIANVNRLRQLTRTEADSDGEIRGFGLPLDHPDVARLAGLVDGLKRLEDEAVLQLQRTMRRHPLGPWVKATVGVGPKQGPRLLAAIGDPYIRPELTRDDGTVEPSRPRTVSELWAYCGYKPGQKRQKGQRSNWSATAKMRAYLVAEKMLQCGNREVYDARRAHTAVTHPDWTNGHSHNDALRVVAKTVLRDLWRAARDIHPGQILTGTPAPGAEVEKP
jgi:hypothetical protein